jgi:DNA invertase Pin-like site-specific DNA recombinase
MQHPLRHEGRLIGYARVSTADQKLDLQIDALKRAGVLEDNIHADKASGARDSRRGLMNAWRDLRRWSGSLIVLAGL